MPVIAFILGFYCFLVIMLIIGWNKSIRASESSRSAPEEFISVIIPVRNEAKQMERLLVNLAKQHYTNFEVIIMDDHSSDDTLKIIRSYPMPQLSVHTNSGQGKKQAITEGVKRSAGQLIVTTDADCSFHPDWLKTMNRYFQDKKVLFLFGGVRIYDTPNFFTKMQAVEFASLIGSAAATAAFNIPTMCNGANLAYRKHVFEEVKGYEGNVHVPSGDDEFLMRKIHKKFPEGILFAA
jgi:poly-beta-1,6-N-acetyl-D-glucosamine synthase